MTRVLWDSVPEAVREQLRARDEWEAPQPGAVAIIDADGRRWYFEKVEAGWNNLATGDAPGAPVASDLDDAQQESARSELDDLIERCLDPHPVGEARRTRPAPTCSKCGAILENDGVRGGASECAACRAIDAPAHHLVGARTGQVSGRVSTVHRLPIYIGAGVPIERKSAHGVHHSETVRVGFQPGSLSDDSVRNLNAMPVGQAVRLMIENEPRPIDGYLVKTQFYHGLAGVGVDITVAVEP